MKEEINKIRVDSMFSAEGEILPEDKREDITETVTFFPEGLAVARVSGGRDMPLRLYGFGGNAKISIHVSVACPETPDQIENAIKYIDKVCESKIKSQLTGYKKFLDAQGFDWKKLEK